MSIEQDQVNTMLESLAQNLEAAEGDVQSAKYSGDERALGYAESRVMSLKREIARIDPLGVGRPYVGYLTAAERNLLGV